jgi:exodeoxyribonuclease VII small subunit
MAKTPAAPDQPSSYESAQQELEQLVARMETGQLPLDDLLQAYQRGAFLISFCKTKLDSIEQQIKILEDGKLKDWKPTT